MTCDYWIKIQFSWIGIYKSCYHFVRAILSNTILSGHPAFMFDYLHWLPLIPRIQLKVLTLIYRSHIGQTPRYLRDLMRLPSSTICLRPLRSLDRHDLFVPRARTSTAQAQAFAIPWPCALEPTPSFYTIHFISRGAKYLFSFSQDCSLLSVSLTLEALLIGVHCKKRYINV